MKNHNKSYFALSMKALIPTCCSHIVSSRNIIVVKINIKINCITYFDWQFFISRFRVIFWQFSLFFISFIRDLRFIDMYRINITISISSINSFHIQNRVRNFQSRHSLNVMNVCKKNCIKSHIINILHNNEARYLMLLFLILDNWDVSFFMVFGKNT